MLGEDSDYWEIHRQCMKSSLGTAQVHKKAEKLLKEHQTKRLSDETRRKLSQITRRFEEMT
jgi:hypothetical protein